MKNIFRLIVFLLGVCVLLTSCGSVEKNGVKEEITDQLSKSKTAVQITKVEEVQTQSKSDFVYEFGTATIEQDKIKIKYPQIKGMADESKQNQINEKIRNDIWDKAVGLIIESNKEEKDFIKKLNLDLDFQVLFNDNYISVVYNGYRYIDKDANPANEIYTTTIDMDTAKLMKLSDFVKLNVEFVQKIKNATYIPNEGIENKDDQKTVFDYVKETEDSSILSDLLRNETNSFYFTKDDLVVSVPIIHALGDHALFSIHRSDLN